MARKRDWCFTAWKTSQHYIDLCQDGGIKECGIKYITWGEETCPLSGREHLQGYVEFTEGVTLRTAKRRLDDANVHLAARKGTAAEAIGYCLKHPDGASQPKVCYEFGKKPKQGKRIDLEKVRDLLGSGAGMRTILRSGCNYQGARFAQLWLSYLEEPRTIPPKVIWMWGATGTGKTRASLVEATAQFPEDIWWSNGMLHWVRWEVLDAGQAQNQRLSIPPAG